jgi:hypothetical protein
MKYSIEQFVALESGVWEAMLAGDPEKDKALLTENFLGVYNTGFSNREEHCNAIAAGPVAATYKITEPRIMILSTGIVIFSYLAIWTPIRKGKVKSEEKMYISSIWQEFGGTWLNIFSQDTEADQNAPCM